VSQGRGGWRLYAELATSKEDIMALRVPKAELPAELRENMIRLLGAVPEPVEVSYNNPRVAVSSQEFSAGVATCSRPWSGTCLSTPRP
jgi:hypothetical protein